MLDEETRKKLEELYEKFIDFVKPRYYEGAVSQVPDIQRKLASMFKHYHQGDFEKTRIMLREIAAEIIKQSKIMFNQEKDMRKKIEKSGWKLLKDKS